MSPAGPGANSPEPGEPTTDFDARQFPDNVLPVIFVSGTPYEMGHQYGQQAADLIKTNACFIESELIANCGTWAAIVERASVYKAIVEAKTPEMIELWQGIADGSGQSFETVTMINVSMEIGTPVAKARNCSTISAWGSATKNGQVIAGSNADGCGYYRVNVIAYPNEGNSFMVVGSEAGGLKSPRVMNEKGVVLMGSAGQAARPEDNAPAYPVMVADVYALWKSDTAALAKDLLVSLGRGGMGDIDNVLDASGDAYVIETTSAACGVRTSGDFGERDYLVATNFFLTETMQPANYADQSESGEIDDWYRYGTMEEFIKTTWGDLSIDTLMRILSCHDYYGTRDPVTGAVDTSKPQLWHRNVWSLEPVGNEQSGWTPGVRALAMTNDHREIWLPGEMTLYLMVGSDDPNIAAIPHATGRFYKLVLAKSPAEVAAASHQTTLVQIWHAARNLDLAKYPSAALEAKLDDAKVAIWEGINLESQAAISADPSQAALLYGRATTCFCKAQCYAEQAQGLDSTCCAPP